MFGTLLESSKSRQSHTGFTIMSAVAHAALVVGAAAATTRAGRPDAAPKPPEVVDMVFTVPDVQQQHVARRATVRTDPASPRRSMFPPIDRQDLIIPPVGIPQGLPPLNASVGTQHPADYSRVPGFRNAGPITGSYLGSGAADGAVRTAAAVDRVVALRVRAEPAYPGALLRSGIEGTVRVRFVVDTLGRVEPASVEIGDSAHEAFSEAVRAVLPRLRFVPAEVAGRPVRQLVEMPFVFALKR